MAKCMQVVNVQESKAAIVEASEVAFRRLADLACLSSTSMLATSYLVDSVDGYSSDNSATATAEWTGLSNTQELLLYLQSRVS